MAGCLKMLFLSFAAAVGFVAFELTGALTVAAAVGLVALAPFASVDT